MIIIFEYVCYVETTLHLVAAMLPLVCHESAFLRQVLSHELQLCYIEDEGGPLGIAIQVEIPNHHKLLWSKAMVVSVMGKGEA